MFTGIIESIGTICSIESRGIDCRLKIETGGSLLAGAIQGDSIAVDGVCLTVVDFSTENFSADVSQETLSRTILKGAKVGDRVNIEAALTATSKIGGHFVTGHVDGVGKVLLRQKDGRSVRFTIKAPLDLGKYIAEKGSISVNGISLTVNRVNGCDFQVNIVPHTLSKTTLGSTLKDCAVNLEVDLVARYVERLLTHTDSRESRPGLTNQVLKSWDF